jgi:two-component system, cell cycle sensor histidine kinase and response regulator CckA
MSKRSEEGNSVESLRQQIIGLGERSIRKNYYPRLREHVAKLERFRALLDQTTDAIFLVQGPVGKVVDVNESASRQLGRERDELLVMTVDEIWPRSVSESIKRLFMSDSQSPAPVVVDLDITPRDKRRFPVEITLRLVRLDDADYVVAVSRDITERRLAEEKYRSIFENALDGIFQCTLDGRWISANPALARILGYESPQELIDNGVDLSSQVYVDPQRREHLIHLARQGRIISEFEVQLYRRDGATIWVSINARPIFDEAGQPVVLEGAVQNVTERKAAEAALRESETRHRTLVENSPIGIASYDLRGNIVDLNAALPRITDEPSLEATKAINLFEFPPLVAAGVSEALIRCVTSGEIVVGEFPYRSEWGKDLHLRLHLAPIWSPDGNVVGGQALVEDISESKRLEEQLRQSAKMEAIGRLAGGIAHDFNNLLTAILGYSGLLIQQIPHDSPQREQVAQISRAAERAAVLIRHLLAFSRKQILDTRPLNLGDTVAGFKNMLRRIIGEDIELITDVAEDLGNVLADCSQVEQILMNLAVNARDAMPFGGALIMEARNVELDENYASERLDAIPGPYVMLSVSDNGSGMDAETCSRIFEPFFTTKAQRGGTGLGMATVYGIVKQHRGHIAVYSHPGQGTTFKVYFPRVDMPAAPVIQHPEATPPHRGEETVLLVEDEEIVRNLTSEALSMLGYTVLQAGDGEEALEVCRRHQGEIQLLLTDVVLPQMDGRTLYEAVSRLRSGMKVLYVSGYAETFVVQHGVLSEGVHFLHKPFTVDRLAAKVAEVLSW